MYLCVSATVALYQFYPKSCYEGQGEELPSGASCCWGVSGTSWRLPGGGWRRTYRRVAESLVRPGNPGIPPEEQEEVSREQQVWDSLLQLLALTRPLMSGWGRMCGRTAGIIPMDPVLIHFHVLIFDDDHNVKQWRWSSQFKHTVNIQRQTVALNSSLVFGVTTFVACPSVGSRSFSLGTFIYRVWRRVKLPFVCLTEDVIRQELTHTVHSLEATITAVQPQH